MDRLLCNQCAAASYSAAAKTLVETGERCPRCGGPLTLVPAEPVGVAASGSETEAIPAPASRRFGSRPTATG
jgi:uncharacterized protein with PIN domain